MLLPDTEAGVRLVAQLGLDHEVRAAIVPDVVWAGSVPGYTAAEVIRTLVAVRVSTAAVDPFGSASVPQVGTAARVVGGCLQAVLVLSGRTTYEQLTADQWYLAYDLPRRLDFLADAVEEPRVWSGVRSRALWVGGVAEYAGLDVAPTPARGLVALAPLLTDLGTLQPRPGAEPTAAALRVVEPVLVTMVQRAARWAVVAATALLRPDADRDAVDRTMPRASGHRLPSALGALHHLGATDLELRHRHAELVRAEAALAAEVAPSKRAGGHMDVRPDEDRVAELTWQADSAAAALAVLCRRLLAGRSAALTSLAYDAAQVLEAVETRDAGWPDDAVRAMRQFADLTLTLTAASVL